jgi:hypothetical protein
MEWLLGTKGRLFKETQWLAPLCPFIRRRPDRASYVGERLVFFVLCFFSIAFWWT